MAVGDTITAARYNIIQARIAAVIGLGSGDEGYGQARTSSTAAVGATITAQDMSNLFTDMNKIRLHQAGAVPTEIVAPSVGDTVEDSNSTSKEGYVQYEALSTTCQASRLTAAASQLGLQAGTSSGTINLSGTIGSGNTTINNDWRNLMTSVGTVVFGRSTTSNGSVGTNYGYSNLPTGYTTLFNKTASAYSANDYLIEGQKNGAVLTFRVTFNEDKGPNPNYDEAVTATTTSTVQLNRPNNASSVNIAAPTFANTNNL